MVMRKKEQRIWDAFAPRAPRGVWLRRVENVVGEGDPDVWFRSRCTEGWLELKAPTAPSRAETRLLGDEGLRPAQVNWWLKYTSLGGVGWVLIRDNLGELFLVPGRHAKAMNDAPRGQLAAWSEAASWEAIFARIQEPTQ